MKTCWNVTCTHCLPLQTNVHIHTLSRKAVMANGKANKVINYLEEKSNPVPFKNGYLWMMIPRRLYRTCWLYLMHDYFSLALVLSCGKKFKLLSTCTWNDTRINYIVFIKISLFKGVCVSDKQVCDLLWCCGPTGLILDRRHIPITLRVKVILKKWRNG